MNTASWVVREKASGAVLFETFNPRLVAALKPKYEAVPILAYLGALNRAGALCRSREQE